MAREFSIEPYLNNAEILNKTAEQIQKDFAFFDLTINFTPNCTSAYTLLYEEVLPQIKKLLQANSQKIYALLYRIDINETRLKTELLNNQTQTTEEIITQLIVKRCLQKVVLRKLFS